MESKSDLQKKHFGTSEVLEIFAKGHEDHKKEFENMPRDLKEWAETDFPYYVPENELPSPLPTMAEIEAARGTENDLTRNPHSRNFVYRISKVYAVKFSLTPIIIQVKFWPLIDYTKTKA